METAEAGMETAEAGMETAVTGMETAVAEMESAVTGMETAETGMECGPVALVDEASLVPLSDWQDEPDLAEVLPFQSILAEACSLADQQRHGASSPVPVPVQDSSMLAESALAGKPP